jgi:hypothetical protein
MKKIQILAATLLSLAAIAGCRSNDDENTKDTKDTQEFACTCGEPDADFFGCLHPLCADGKTNPDNPECACGPLID